MSPAITIVWDANVGLETPCLQGDDDVPDAAGRRATQSVAREPGLAISAQSACVPEGFVLAGWTDQNTPVDSSTPQTGAATFNPDFEIPEQWLAVSPNPVNRVHLYALWQPAER